MAAAIDVICPECGHKLAPRKSETLRCGSVELDTSDMLLSIDGKQIRRLPQYPGRVLAELMRYQGRTCSRDHLLNINSHWDVGPHIVSVEVYKLRKVLKGSGVQIVTIPTVGFKLLAKKDVS